MRDHIDHIVPLVRGGLHHPDNLHVVPWDRNLAKHDLTEEEFQEYRRTGVRRRDRANDINLDLEFPPLSELQRRLERKHHKNNTSGLKGAYWLKKRGKWGALIVVNGKRIWLGYAFDTPEEAHAAYCAAVVKYFGEFANFREE